MQALNKCCLIFVFLLLILGCAKISAQTNKYVVTGKVIGDDEKPLTNAYVVLDSRLSCEKWQGWEDIRNGASTDENGDFRIESFQSLPPHIEFLYVSSPTVGFSKISPPFLNDCHGINFLPPHPILLEAGKEVDAGMLAVQIWYSPVTIYLIDKNNQPLFTAKEWESVKLRYEDAKGKFAGEKNIDEDDFIDSIDVSLGSVTVSLPEGVWKIAVVSKKTLDLNTGNIIIRKNSPLKIILRPRLNSAVGAKKSVRR